MSSDHDQIMALQRIAAALERIAGMPEGGANNPKKDQRQASAKAVIGDAEKRHEVQAPS